MERERERVGVGDRGGGGKSEMIAPSASSLLIRRKIFWVTNVKYDPLSPARKDATLLANNPNIVECFASACTPCWMLLRVVGSCWNRSDFWTNNFQNFFFRDYQSVAQQYWIRLHSSSNIVRATNPRYTWSLKSSGLYPSHDAMQVPTLLGVVASACTTLPTRTQQLPKLLGQRCWE